MESSKTVPGDTVYIIKNVDMVTGVGVGVKEAQCCVYYDPGGGRGVLLCRARKVVAGEEQVEGTCIEGNSSGGSISERGKELGPGVGGHGMGDGVLSLLVQVPSICPCPKRTPCHAADGKVGRLGDSPGVVFGIASQFGAIIALIYTLPSSSAL